MFSTLRSCSPIVFVGNYFLLITNTVDHTSRLHTLSLDTVNLAQKKIAPSSPIPSKLVTRVTLASEGLKRGQ